VVARGIDRGIKKLEMVPTLVERNQVHQAIIIDDRDDVWEEDAKGCVMLTRPFYFFDTLGANLPPLMMQGSTSRLERYLKADPESDEQLHWTFASTLVKVHAEMALIGAGADVQQAVENVRKRILDGVVVVFAGRLIEIKREDDEQVRARTVNESALGRTATVSPRARVTVAPRSRPRDSPCLRRAD
jgi:hypothetical protein